MRVTRALRLVYKGVALPEELVGSNTLAGAKPLLRSVLYLPASNERALEKARSLPCDALILDLEDAVAPSAKAAAREKLLKVLSPSAEVPYSQGHHVVVRINGLGTPWFEDDVQAFGELLHQYADSKTRPAIQAIAIPKVEQPETVAQVSASMPAGTPLWAMIETPLGVLNCQSIARGTDSSSSWSGEAGGPAVLVAGTSDLTRELNAKHTKDRLPLLYSLSQMVLAAKANKIPVLDGVHLDLQDTTGYVDAVIQGRSMGFDGKTLIHPSQVEAANNTYAPSAEDVALAIQIVQAFTEAEAAGQGVVVVNGKLIENLHVAQAKDVLALAASIAARTAAN